jgi:ribosome-binding protein aMBF1 (putative translation factor)
VSQEGTEHMNVQVIEVEGVEYAILPRAELERLTRGEGGLTDGQEYTRQLIAHDLRRAREAAGITQAELARRIGRSRSMVAGAERGHQRVGAPYVERVLKACGLPKDWRPDERPED